jgi:TatD DNase family protein
LELVNQYPKNFDEKIQFYSIGIHPWYIKKESIDFDLEIITKQIQNNNGLAIGECGLDKRIEIDFDLQVTVFEKQILLAEKFQKPVVIHCVAAFQEIISIKKKFNITIPTIIHGFSKNKKTAKNLIDNGFYLSFGKYLIQNPALEEVFKSVPINKIFLETDSSNNSIESVYQLAAKCRNITLSELQNTITANFNAVFKENN